MGRSEGVYSPLNTLKPVAEDLWIVDGPTIRFGMPWPKIAFPTRMTIIRLDDGLFIHSPTPLTERLREELAPHGAPQWIVGPNRLHYWWIPEWRDCYRGAEVYLAPGIYQQGRTRIDFPARALDSENGYPWDWEVSTLPIAGSYMTEVVFFHHASRTLVLTDLIENFEPGKLGSSFARWITRLGGAQDPNGSMPRDMRLAFSKQKTALRRAVLKMIAWNPHRIILAHGRWYDQNGVMELRRAFSWLLG